jgi:hypothetical protein
MSQRKIIYFVTLLLAFFCSVAFAQELVCDLKQGKLNSLKIGMKVEPGDIERAIGKPADEKKATDLFISSEYIDYYYFKDGFHIFTSRRKENEPYRIRTIVVYLQQTDNEEGSYSKFKGKVIPLITGNESRETIKSRFGTSHPSLTGSVTMGYKTAYGEYDFKFNENGLYRMLMIIGAD